VVATVGGGEEEPAGVVEASVVSPEGVFRPKAVVHIHSLYVKPGYRGEGIARRLLEEALDWGRGRGCLEAELNVLAKNPARRLYERAGFEVAELEMRLEL
jgi:GNAT superfamily N-acetyltransferase